LGPPAKFVRRYGDAAALIREAVEHYPRNMEHRAFLQMRRVIIFPARHGRNLKSDSDDENGDCESGSLQDWES